jgi:hypothetical protein
MEAGAGGSIKLRNDLTSSRVGATLPFHARLIVHRRLGLIFIPMSGPKAHVQLIKYPETESAKSTDEARSGYIKGTIKGDIRCR